MTPDQHMQAIWVDRPWGDDNAEIICEHCPKWRVSVPADAVVGVIEAHVFPGLAGGAE